MKTSPTEHREPDDERSERAVLLAHIGAVIAGLDLERAAGRLRRAAADARAAGAAIFARELDLLADGLDRKRAALEAVLDRAPA